MIFPKKNISDKNHVIRPYQSSKAIIFKICMILTTFTKKYTNTTNTHKNMTHNTTIQPTNHIHIKDYPSLVENSYHIMLD